MGTLLICAAGQIVGTIACVKTGCYDALEVGYTVFDESNRNKGFATEALFLFSKYLFSTRKVNRQQVSINPGNATSKRVAVKCGFTFEGILREALFTHGEYQDVAVYSLLRDDVNKM